MKEEFIWTCQENYLKILSVEGEVGSLNKKLEKYEEKSEDMEAHNRKEAVIISRTAVSAASTNEGLHSIVPDTYEGFRKQKAMCNQS